VSVFVCMDVKESECATEQSWGRGGVERASEGASKSSPHTYRERDGHRDNDTASERATDRNTHPHREGDRSRDRQERQTKTEGGREQKSAT